MSDNTKLLEELDSEESNSDCKWQAAAVIRGLEEDLAACRLSLSDVTAERDTALQRIEGLQHTVEVNLTQREAAEAERDAAEAYAVACRAKADRLVDTVTRWMADEPAIRFEVVDDAYRSLRDWLTQNPNPSGHINTEASGDPAGVLTPEASGPVGLGPHGCHEIGIPRWTAEQVAAVRAEGERLADELGVERSPAVGQRCPIGLDATPNICSASTCDVCEAMRPKKGQTTTAADVERIRQECIKAEHDVTWRGIKPPPPSWSDVETLLYALDGCHSQVPKQEPTP